ncbi:MAG: hypothetical protein JWL84_6261 [Rhodospirillales bacterium]|nr:hypothetical protein [Rhodospirillales bacterium]
MPAAASRVRIGTAGWSIPRPVRARFPESGSALERYAAVFDVAEIDSSFQRPHQPKTYRRWAASVPAHFRFAVKIPKLISHERRLCGIAEPLDRFLAEAGSLGEKLGPLLVQLPPSLAFDAVVADAFFTLLRSRFAGPVVCEPRNVTWFTHGADALLNAARIARVATDPAKIVEAAVPGAWPGIAYYRLHGSPRMYYSEYGSSYLAALAERFDAVTETWCIFDNTASGAALADALALHELTRSVVPKRNAAR